MRYDKFSDPVSLEPPAMIGLMQRKIATTHSSLRIVAKEEHFRVYGPTRGWTESVFYGEFTDQDHNFMLVGRFDFAPWKRVEWQFAFVVIGVGIVGATLSIMRDLVIGTFDKQILLVPIGGLFMLGVLKIFYAIGWAMGRRGRS